MLQDMCVRKIERTLFENSIIYEISIFFYFCFFIEMILSTALSNKSQL